MASDDAWHLHSGVAPPLTFARLRVASHLATYLSLPIFAFLLAPLAARYRQLRGGRRSDSTKSRIVFWMLLSISADVAIGVGNLFLLSPLGTDVTVCRSGQKYAVVLFGIASWAGYWVLLIRAERTLDRESRLHMFVFQQSKLALKFGMPMVILAGGVLFEGRVLFDSTCSQELSAYVAAVFMLLDLNISVLLVLLFYLPVRKHAQAVHCTGVHKMQQEAQGLLFMARRALRLSLLQQSTMLVCQLFGVISALLGDDSADPMLSYLRELRWVGFAASLLINAGTMLAMSSAWLPPDWHWWHCVVWARIGPGQVATTATAREGSVSAGSSNVPSRDSAARQAGTSTAKVTPEGVLSALRSSTATNSEQ